MYPKRTEQKNPRLSSLYIPSPVKVIDVTEKAIFSFRLWHYMKDISNDALLIIELSYINVHDLFFLFISSSM